MKIIIGIGLVQSTIIITLDIFMVFRQLHLKVRKFKKSTTLLNTSLHSCTLLLTCFCTSNIGVL